MYLTSEAKREIFKQHGGEAKNTGGSESQIALFTKRIDHLTEHLKVNKKDHATEKSLVRLVGQRKQLLNYLKMYHIDRYRAIINTLGLRK
jgi:small subunit ribosomal protein S15